VRPRRSGIRLATAGGGEPFGDAGGEG